MGSFYIKGGNTLEGEVKVSGAKNAVLPILAASVLGAGRVLINRVPNLRDVRVMRKVLTHLGAEVIYEQDRMIVDTSYLDSCEIPQELMKQMRASIFLMGPLLARYGKVKISQPGGCTIGPRPIDLHLKGLKALGVEFRQRNGFLIGEAEQLTGNNISLDFPSVGATENLMMAATAAQGVTKIDNVAREPEIVNLQNFLNRLGAKIRGAGTSSITIKGVNQFSPTEYEVIPDRIEASTFLIAGAITKGEVLVKDIIPEHLEATISKLSEMGIKMRVGSNWVKVLAGDKWQGTSLKTLPYPGLATDVQPQFMALLALAKGSSLIKESIFTNRLKHAAELRRMGANIRVEESTAIIKGVKELSGAIVEATDLRAGAALVLAGLVAEGESIVKKIHHIDRGYENLEHKLARLGADITRTDKQEEYLNVK